MKPQVVVLIALPILALLVNPSPAKPASNQKSFEKAVLTRHNFYRKMAGIPTMVWHKGLAKRAQNWAKKLRQTNNCKLKHSPKTYRRNVDSFKFVGENLHWYRSSKPFMAGAAQATRAADNWYREIRDFQYSAKGVVCAKRGQKKAIGHFTQLMWADSTHLGCGFAQCGNNTSVVVVCNYGPAGNFNKSSTPPFSEAAAKKLNKHTFNKQFGGLPRCDG